MAVSSVASSRAPSSWKVGDAHCFSVRHWGKLLACTYAVPGVTRAWSPPSPLQLSPGWPRFHKKGITVEVVYIFSMGVLLCGIFK